MEDAVSPVAHTEEVSKANNNDDSVKKSEVLDSISRVYPFEILRYYLIQGQVSKAKFWTVGFVSSGVKTIVFMGALSIYSLLST